MAEEKTTPQEENKAQESQQKETKPSAAPAAKEAKTTAVSKKTAKAASDLTTLAKQLVGLSVLEVSELGKILKDDYGIEPATAAVAAVAAPEAGAAGGEAESKSSFDVVLKEAGGQKVAVIKAVKEITGLGLGEAKALVDTAPKNVKDGVGRDEADRLKAQLEEAGATVELT